MSYKNKTYVVFDGDNDMWAYAYMKGWKQNDRIDFDFHDAHDIRPLTDRAGEETVKKALRERMSSAKQIIVLIGESTKNLYRFVRWEIDAAISRDLPILAVNLNGLRRMDDDLCPPILKGKYVVHIPFKLAVIKHALDQFPTEYHARSSEAGGDRFYYNETYSDLGL